MRRLDSAILSNGHWSVDCAYNAARAAIAEATPQEAQNDMDELKPMSGMFGLGCQVSHELDRANMVPCTRFLPCRLGVIPDKEGHK